MTCTEPVMKDASSDARKQTNLAMSSGTPSLGTRCVAVNARCMAAWSSACSQILVFIGVSIVPGA
jgi:hypothetical protein